MNPVTCTSRTNEAEPRNGADFRLVSCFEDVSMSPGQAVRQSTLPSFRGESPDFCEATVTAFVGFSLNGSKRLIFQTVKRRKTLWIAFCLRLELIRGTPPEFST